MLTNKKDITNFMAEKGLCYTNLFGQRYTAGQVFTAAGDTSDMKKTVMARVMLDGKQLFYWGFHYPEDAYEVAKTVKRLRKVDVYDVIVFEKAEWV
jgi:hypothetical protein